ncbi:hypothetical protein BJX70DRAFT_395549 [Aspergillus crustosus]
MAQSPRQRPSLLAGLALTILLFTPLTDALPIPIRDSIRPNPPRINLQPRSPDPDPRMIPDRTDLLAQIFATLGIEELDKFNKLQPEEHGDDGAGIDDSQSTTHTVTAYDNEDVKPVAGGGVKGDSAKKGSGSVHEDNKGENTKPDATATATAGNSQDESKDETKTETEADTETQTEGKDAAEDTDTFVETLFEVLKKEFRETINSSDEVALR